MSKQKNDLTMSILPFHHHTKYSDYQLMHYIKSLWSKVWKFGITSYITFDSLDSLNLTKILLIILPDAIT